MTLPDGLKFLEFGWWVMHAVSIALVWLYAYRKGRNDERKRHGGRPAPRAAPPSRERDDPPGRP